MEWILKKDLDGHWVLFKAAPEGDIVIPLERNLNHSVDWLLREAEKTWPKVA